MSKSFLLLKQITMKKYELIKWYPSLYNHWKKGDIAVESNNETPIYFGKKLTDTLYTTISSKEVENNPEFWEEIIKYPIGTKVYNSHTNTIYTKKEDGWYKPMDKTAYTDEMINNKKHLTLLDKDIDKNPLKLEVGKEYILQYIHCKSKPQHIKITGFTGDGYPWKERVSDGGLKGIVSPGSYRLIGEVIEKDYKILTLITNVQGRISDFSNADSDYLEAMLKDKENVKIHSVKRLSDGEVFTVGDKVKKPHRKQPFKIKHFHIQNCNPPIVWLHSMDFVEGTCTQTLDVSCTLDKAIKYEKPLFTTEDGVDIYGGDKFWAANINRFIVKEKFACVNCTIKLWESKKWIIYSTKEAAEEYINSRKPYLSNKDVLDEIEKCTNIQQLKKVFTNKVAY